MYHPWGGRIYFSLSEGSTSTSFVLYAAGSYLPPDSDEIDFSLEDGYSSPELSEITFSLTAPPQCDPYVPPVWDEVDATLDDNYDIPLPEEIIVVLDPCDSAPPEIPFRGLYLSLGARWGASKKKSANPMEFPYGAVPTLDIQTAIPYNYPDKKDPEIQSPWNGMPTKNLSSQIRWGDVPRLDLGLESSWNKTYRMELTENLPWNSAEPSDSAVLEVPWNRVFAYDNNNLIPWNRALLPGLMVDPPPFLVPVISSVSNLPNGGVVDFLLAPVDPESNPFLIDLEEVLVYRSPNNELINLILYPEDSSLDLVLTGTGIYVPSNPIDSILPGLYIVPDPLSINTKIGTILGITFEVVDPDPYLQQRTDPFLLNFSWGKVPYKDISLEIPWGSGSWAGRDPIVGVPWVNEPQPPPVPPPFSPDKPVYIVMNSVNVVRLPERTVIHVSSVSINGAVDALYWSFTAELSNPNQLALLKKDETGPKEIEVTVNGHVWVFLVEDYDDGKEFVNQVVSLTGRSRTALLSEPFAPARSFVNDVPFTIQQLMERELQDTGFSLDYDTVDWVVPAEAFYYQDLTPMEVISRLAEASGAVVQAHPVNKQIVIRARYPTSPWDWDTVDPDKGINENQIRNTSTQNKTLPLYDFVLVSGESQGVSDIIQRTGSGGEVRRPMVVDSLILTHPASQERGRNILSDRGEQAIISMSLQLNPAATPPGRILPLELVSIEEDEDTWLGLNLSTSITASMDDSRTLEVWMNVALERHYND
jgi:hypothetical protein